jgi:hypothetical protein
VNIAAIAADLVQNDRQIASRLILEFLHIPKTVDIQILKEDFCSRDFLLHGNATAHKAANFSPKKYYSLLSPPHPPPPPKSVLSRFISARLFSVSQVENEVKRTPLSGCC